jgi:hypothetical protein
MKTENNIISEWLDKNGDPKIYIQVLEEALELQLKQQSKMFSEEEVLVLLHKRDAYNFKTNAQSLLDWQTPKEWFEQFKNK